MYQSAFIARLIGPLLLINAFAILVNRKGFAAMVTGAARNPAVIYLAGMMTLLGGLAIVQVHNVWCHDWSVLITMFGWMAVVGGSVRMLFPNELAKMAERMAKHQGWMVVSAALYALLGALMTVKGSQLVMYP